MYELYYVNGKLRCVKHYVHNKLEAECIYYYRNGKIQLKELYNRGYPIDVWTLYNENGTIQEYIKNYINMIEN